MISVKLPKTGTYAPTSPKLGNNPNFLSILSEPTYEMVRWYYSTPVTETVNYRRIDDKCSVVEIVDRYGDDIKTRSITIGKQEKRTICTNYLFYHRK